MNDGSNLPEDDKHENEFPLVAFPSELVEELSSLAQYVVGVGVHYTGVGQHLIMRFPNNYGVSVIRTPTSYGGYQGLFEMAVTYWQEDNYHICRNLPSLDETSILLEFSDTLVLGHLTPAAVILRLKAVLNLPPYIDPLPAPDPSLSLINALSGLHEEYSDSD